MFSMFALPTTGQRQQCADPLRHSPINATCNLRSTRNFLITTSPFIIGSRSISCGRRCVASTGKRKAQERLISVYVLSRSLQPAACEPLVYLSCAPIKYLPTKFGFFSRSIARSLRLMRGTEEGIGALSEERGSIMVRWKICSGCKFSPH